jgi:hypothetical protein
MTIQNISEYTVLAVILDNLKAIIAREHERSKDCKHLTYSMQALLKEEIIPQLQNELDCDPTAKYLYDNTEGEPSVTLKDMLVKAWRGNPTALNNFLLAKNRKEWQEIHK